jgi:hypothetical protein
VETSQVFVRESASGRMVAAQLFDDISDIHLEAWQTQWLTYLGKTVSRLQTEGALQDFPEDAHWRWDQKIKCARGILAYRAFCIVCNQQLQGMMLVNMSKTARLPEQVGKDLVYIVFLATAPWNRKSLEPTPKYQGVGRLLIGTAVDLSFHEEFKGRVGLHSLPGG